MDNPFLQTLMQLLGGSQQGGVAPTAMGAPPVGGQQQAPDLANMISQLSQAHAQSVAQRAPLTAGGAVTPAQPLAPMDLSAGTSGSVPTSVGLLNNGGGAGAGGQSGGGIAGLLKMFFG